MANKRVERCYVEQLRHAIADFPSGVVVGGESPDFVVGSGADAVGIEVTLFHWPAPEGERRHQEQQALKDRVVSTAGEFTAKRVGLGYTSACTSPNQSRSPNGALTSTQQRFRGPCWKR